MSGQRPPAGDEVETVDLTFSSSPSPSPSPEPQRRPRHQHPHPPDPRQHGAPTYPTTERGATSGRPTGASSSKPRPPQTATNASHPLPIVSSEHLRQIVCTSAPGEVANLLLELCKSSPALSGAVARGLAPHSTWAQSTIKNYQRRNGITRAKSELKKSSSSSSVAIPGRSPERRNYQSPRTPYMKAPDDFEADTLEPASDDSLTDVEVLLEHSSRSSKGKAVAGPSSSTSRTVKDPPPPQPALSVRVKPEMETTGLFCMQCDQTIQPGKPCRFHLGHTRISVQGTRKIPVWTCCERPQSATGCCAGDHIPLEKKNRESTLTGPKKPRLI